MTFSQSYSTACWSHCILQHPDIYTYTASCPSRATKRQQRSTKTHYTMTHDYKCEYIIKLPGKYTKRVILGWEISEQHQCTQTYARFDPKQPLSVVGSNKSYNVYERQLHLLTDPGLLVCWHLVQSTVRSDEQHDRWAQTGEIMPLVTALLQRYFLETEPGS